MKKARQLLDYVATQEDAIVTFQASDMVLAVHSDASYLSEPNARSRAGGHFFLTKDDTVMPNNGAILTVAQIIKTVMSSAAEAELGALFINAREAVYTARSWRNWGIDSRARQSKRTTQRQSWSSTQRCSRRGQRPCI